MIIKQYKNIRLAAKEKKGEYFCAVRLRIKCEKRLLSKKYSYYRNVM
jgi:hypothetical protein